MKQPVAYTGKSRVTSDHTVSWAIQEAAIRKAAEAHGHPDPLFLSDWNRSGRGVASSTRVRGAHRERPEWPTQA